MYMADQKYIEDTVKHLNLPHNILIICYFLFQIKKNIISTDNIFNDKINLIVDNLNKISFLSNA